MRSIRILGAAVLLLLFAIPAAYADDADGATLYAAKCASCHGDDGKGTAQGRKLGVPRLSDDSVQDRSDKFLRNHVANGRDKMPAFGAEMAHEQIIDVVIHVRSFWVPRQAAK